MSWMIPGPIARSDRGSIVVVLWSVLVLAGCASRDRARVVDVEPPGRTQFGSYCAACHQMDGQGVEAEAPPLVGSSWVMGPEDRLIRILLHGVRGPIEVSGKVYNREMPGFGQVLGDADIALLGSFVRRSFGGSSAPIEAAAVGVIRAADRQRTVPWTVEELLAGR